MPSGDRLDRPLQFGQRKFLRHQFEHDRAVFQLGAEPRDGGRENPAVIEAHRLAERGERLPRECGFASVAPRFFEEARFIQELVALKHFFLVPGRALDAESEAKALASTKHAARLTRRGLRPASERGEDRVVEYLWSSV